MICNNKYSKLGRKFMRYVIQEANIASNISHKISLQCLQLAAAGMLSTKLSLELSFSL